MRRGYAADPKSITDQCPNIEQPISLQPLHQILQPWACWKALANANPTWVKRRERVGKRSRTTRYKEEGCDQNEGIGPEFGVEDQA